MPQRAGRPFPDTTMGGAGKGFPQTSWGLVSRLKKTTPEERRAGLEALCRSYWRPVYQYVRIAWSKSNEDAKDLCQAFFLWLLEGDTLKRYEPERGGFRNYLKGLLRRFLNHRETALQRLKRGGGAVIVPLDGDVREIRGKPEEVFDREWRSQLLTQAVDKVRDRLVASGRGPQWRAYAEYELAAGPRPTYPELAAKLRVKESDVRNALFAVRGAIREEIRLRLTETTADHSELEDEWNELFGR